MIKPPPGFVLDEQPGEPAEIKPPPGFVLDDKPTVSAKLEEFVGNVGRNAADWVNPRKVIPALADTVKQGLLDIPRDLAESSVQVLQTGAQAVVGKKPLSDVGKTIVNSPIMQRTKQMTQPMATDPANFAFERPLDAAALLLAPIVPFLRRGASTGALKGKTAGQLPTAPGESGPSLGRRLTAKAISTTLGAPEDAILERMQNPTGVKTAFSHPELAEQMVTSVKNLSETVREMDIESRTTLRSSPFIQDGAIPKARIGQAIKAARRDLGGVFSKESEAAAKALKNVTGLYKKLRNTVSETQVKDLIEQLDSDINWDDVQATRTNEALVGVRRRLDGLLKNQNPHYREAMVPVAEAVDVLQQMQKQFGISGKTGKGFQLSDQTVGKIRSALKEDRLGTQKILDRYKAITGEDVESKIRGANISAAFEGEKTQGSRRAVIGGAIAEAGSRMVGLPPYVGGAIGAVVGGFADIYGRRIAGLLADGLSQPNMRRYLPGLQRAAAKGHKALAAFHAKLIETDPDYTATMTSAISARVSENNRGGKR